MYCASINFIVQKLLAEVQPILTVSGKARMDIETKVLLTLWTLGNQECFRQIGDRFSVDRGSAHQYCMQVKLTVNCSTVKLSKLLVVSCSNVLFSINYSIILLRCKMLQRYLIITYGHFLCFFMFSCYYLCAVLHATGLIA